MASKDNKPRLSLVTNFSKNIRKNLIVTEEEVAEAKQTHRSNIEMLISDYLSNVSLGEAQGIRHAKDLVEMIKLDMLLLGEPTERTDTNPLSEARIAKVSEVIDLDDEHVQDIVNKMLEAMNEANDTFGK